MKSFPDSVRRFQTARSRCRRCSTATWLAVLAALVPVAAHAQATLTWNGGGADTIWTTAANWGGIAPVAGDTLVFSGTTRPSNTNDFAAATTFDSITLSEGGFTLAGNDLQLSAAGTKLTSTGDSTISLGLAPSSGPLSIAATSGTLTVSGVISGSTGLSKSGGGTLLLSGSNTYSGGTTLSAGLLQLGNANAIQSGNTTVMTISGGTLDLNGQNATLNGPTLSGGGVALGGGTLTLGFNNSNVTMSTVVSGSGTFRKNGTGNLTMNAGNTYSGDTILMAGNIRLGEDDALPTTTVLRFDAVNANRRFQLQGNDQTLAGVDATGATGILIVEAATDGISNAPATLTLNVDTGQTYTFSGLVRNAAGSATNSALTLVKNGAGTQVFSGNGTNNTGPSYSGTTTINAGILEFAGSGALAPATGNNSQIILSGGSVRFSGGISGSPAATPLRTSAITGTGDLLIASWIRIGGSGNTFTGDVIIEDGGRLQLDAATNALPTTSVLRFAADGTERRLLMQGNAQTLAGIDSSAATGGNLIVEAANDGGSNLPATLTLDVAAATSYTFSGYLRDAAGGAVNSALTLQKSGSGTQVLSGAGGTVNYTGPTTIDGGILEFSGTNSVANASAITVNAGGTVRFSGTGTRSNTITGAGDVEKAGSNLVTFSGTNDYAGTTTVSAGGLLINGDHTGTGLASVASGARIGGTGSLAGGLTIASGGLFVFDPADPTLDVTGTVLLDNSFGVASLVNADGTAIDWNSVTDGTYTLIGTTASTFGNITNFGSAAAADIGGGRSAYFADGSLNLVVVPEPSTVALLGGLAAAGVLLARRRLR
jgi:fibronectin-binding autotransporter adhesin